MLYYSKSRAFTGKTALPGRRGIEKVKYRMLLVEDDNRIREIIEDPCVGAFCKGGKCEDGSERNGNRAYHREGNYGLTWIWI